MTIITTAMIEDDNIKEDKGLEVGKVFMGANVLCDLFASITVVIGGRSSVYESKLADAHEAAMSQFEEKHRRWAPMRLSELILIIKWLANLYLWSRSVARRS